MTDGSEVSPRYLMVSDSAKRWLTLEKAATVYGWCGFGIGGLAREAGAAEPRIITEDERQQITDRANEFFNYAAR